MERSFREIKIGLDEIDRMRAEIERDVAFCLGQVEKLHTSGWNADFCGSTGRKVSASNEPGSEKPHCTWWVKVHRGKLYARCIRHFTSGFPLVAYSTDPKWRTGADRDEGLCGGALSELEGIGMAYDTLGLFVDGMEREFPELKDLMLYVRQAAQRVRDQAQAR